MEKIKIIGRINVAAFLGLFLLSISSCTEPTSSPAQGGGNVTFKTAINNFPDRSASSSSHGPISGLGGSVDSIEVTSAGFFVSNMLFFSNTTGDETDVNRTEIILRNDHFILDFESWGSQYIGDKIIAASAYRSIRFTMRPAEANADSLSLALGPVFNTFFRSAPASTVIIRGNIWTGSQKVPFEYRSQLSGNELALFDTAFTVSPGDLPREVDIQLKTFTAFSNGSGEVLDPRDSRNAATIDANLRSSLKAIPNVVGS